MIVVDFAQLHAAISHLESFGREVTECLEDVDRTVAALRASWHGEASGARAQAQQQWADGAEQMKTSLLTLQKVADAAHRNYSDAVSKNGQMWQT